MFVDITSNKRSNVLYHPLDEIFVCWSCEVRYLCGKKHVVSQTVDCFGFGVWTSFNRDLLFYSIFLVKSELYIYKDSKIMSYYVINLRQKASK